MNKTYISIYDIAFTFTRICTGTRNSEIVYALLSSEFSRNFTIDPKRGVVTPTRPLDYEALPINQGHKEMVIRQLRLTVRARDMGTPSLISDVPLIIYLRDVNDNAPVFERALYKRSIPEDSPGGISIVQVRITLDTLYNMLRSCRYKFLKFLLCRKLRNTKRN